MEGFDDVWVLKGKYVAFVMSGDSFRRSPVFSTPEAAQRWANQLKQDEV
ncbi:Cell division activator cedA [Cronobacter condimenti 1330]|uniref:Cell division activator cedA n=3 Tax=Cronobacter condimenti TaxID=1163710 RepID=K8A1S9_9ENTR|nr:Cell division activator cedA [Cronobacter condimenti 1330]